MGEGRQASLSVAGGDLRRCRDDPATRALPGQVQVADEQASSVLRLGELQQQGQALLLDGQRPGGQEGGQQLTRVRARQQQALVFLCKTQGLSACAPRDDNYAGSVPHSLERWDNEVQGHRCWSQTAGSE